jgi:ubiquinone/menaquinone biosynthesis C-methylase UbiE
MFDDARRDLMKIAESNEMPARAGLVLHAAAGYDLLIWLITRGRERVFREEMLRLAHLVPGESVLDVGCGTGTLAIAAKRQVGANGHGPRVGRLAGNDCPGPEESEKGGR